MCPTWFGNIEDKTLPDNIPYGSIEPFHNSTYFIPNRPTFGAPFKHYMISDTLRIR